MEVSKLHLAQAAPATSSPIGSSDLVGSGSGWLSALERTLVSSAPQKGPQAAASDVRISQLSDLMKLQMEVCRHQVQVELVSKVAESGVASVRKLQQPQ